MEAIILTQRHFDIILDKLDKIKEHLADGNSTSRHFIDSKTFNHLMGVSARTSQLWREDKKIGYCQVGNKIYYRRSDIEKFFVDHHQDVDESPAKEESLKEFMSA